MPQANDPADTSGQIKTAALSPPTPIEKGSGETNALTLDPALCPKSATIVIDPGHGGKDPGAVSLDGKLKEKDLTLDIAKRLRKLFQERYPSFKVILTRTDDSFISLSERSAAANSQGTDVFISIHCNASTERVSRGIETYFLSKASSNKEMKLAALENGISTEKMNDLQATLLDLMVTSKKTESEQLATAVSQGLGRVIPSERNRGIKQGPFYVLLGVKMPAILVECAFLSNDRECHKLNDSAYLNKIARGLAEGVLSYLAKIGESGDREP